jgi:uncharacterized protein (TIGR02453 family)
MAKTFPGFSPKAITFLRQLEKNNQREWFQPRKPQFEELLRQPTLELAGMIAEQLRGFAVDHVIPPEKAVHRIYRDVRFSKDKSPYKTNISMRFPRKGLGKVTAGGLYFSLSAHSADVAGGIYMPGPVELAALRSEIDKNPGAFRKTVEDRKMTKITGLLLGEQMSRTPKAFPSDHRAEDLLRRKQFYYYTTMPVTAALSPGLEKILIRQFKAMSPAIEYMNRILLKAASGDDGQHDRPVRPKPMF